MTPQKDKIPTDQKVLMDLVSPQLRRRTSSRKNLFNKGPEENSSESIQNDLAERWKTKAADQLAVWSDFPKSEFFFFC